MISLGLDIGSNSVGSAWIDANGSEAVVGVSIFPAGVEESDEKRGDPKNAKRRATRRTRITLARRAQRKRQLTQKLVAIGLLPPDAEEFEKLLHETDPWVLRRDGLTRPMMPFEFGRVLLHLAQRRGALGFEAEVGDKGTVKTAITTTQLEMLDRYAAGNVRGAAQQIRAKIDGLSKKKKRTEQEDEELETGQGELTRLCKSLLQDPTVTFGRFIADLRDERRKPITTPDQRRKAERLGPREWRAPVRNKAGKFEFHADRTTIRDEFAKLWDAQMRLGEPRLKELLRDELRLALDDEKGDSEWRHKGLLFGQRLQSWDVGTLGRCVLEPTERCVAHADMYASRYLVVETVNNLKIIERGREARPLARDERTKIKNYLSGPLGVQNKGKQKGQPKRSITVTDLRELMGWGHAAKTAQFRFNIEADEDRQINTDWFSREIIYGAVTREKWQKLDQRVREGINRAILRFDPDLENHAAKLKDAVMKSAGLEEAQADAILTAWEKRPRPDAKRLNMSRRAVRNILALMDRDEPWPDDKRPGQFHWLTQIEARKEIAKTPDFIDITTRKPLNEHGRRRYATGAKGATKRDRHYIRKHLLKKNGKLIIGPDGKPLAEPPPAPLITNPVARRAIHEVRRHLVEYMGKFGRKPDEIHIELSREARMGKKDADEQLFRNRLRNRIKNDILAAFHLDSVSSTQQRVAVERVVLCVQQGGVCPLCGQSGLTPRTAASGTGCELAHIVPKGAGGDNGYKNVILAHDKCNRDMHRRTPRQFWGETVDGGFESGIAWVENIYGAIERPKPSDIKDATGNSLLACYFTKRDDNAKVQQFKKDIKDIRGMTARQDAATKYAARQVMAYLADALYGGTGLPERGGKRLIYATDGMWTSRLRREWGLFFDPHKFNAKGLTNQAQSERKEKDRGDHRHHPIDAVVIALCTREVQIAWEEREKKADNEGINTADEQAMTNYRKQHRLPPPPPFKTHKDLQDAVHRAVFGDGSIERPVCHRPVKRKLIGALHKETLFGPVVDEHGNRTDRYTGKASVLQLDANHLRLPQPELEQDALKRLANEIKAQGVPPKQAKQKAQEILNSPAFEPRLFDPPPEKSGLVRDLALRMRIRECLSSHRYVKKNKSGEPTGESWLINPDEFTANEIKQAFEAGAICQKSGVPIKSAVLLRTMTDPIIASRWAIDHKTGNRYKVYDSTNGNGEAAAARAYESRNNHHIEIRVAKSKNGKEKWSGKMVSAYEAAQRKLAKLRAIRHAGVPKPAELRKLSKAARAKWKPALQSIEKAHPLVDRSDDERNGKFVMSLCEGEMLYMKHKRLDEVGYFVVAKLDKPQSIVLVPHWDARSATGRKDAEGKKVPDSKREQFPITPSDLKELAPPGHSHAMKACVTSLGEIRWAAD